MLSLLLKLFQCCLGKNQVEVILESGKDLTIEVEKQTKLQINELEKKLEVLESNLQEACKMVELETVPENVSEDEIGSIIINGTISPKVIETSSYLERKFNTSIIQEILK